MTVMEFKTFYAFQSVSGTCSMHFRNVYNILIGKSKGEKDFWDPCVDGGTISKWTSDK
jgi:hypothetical protein